MKYKLITYKLSLYKCNKLLHTANVMVLPCPYCSYLQLIQTINFYTLVNTEQLREFRLFAAIYTKLKTNVIVFFNRFLKREVCRNVKYSPTAL
jgi:hypothetical protein